MGAIIENDEGKVVRWEIIHHACILTGMIQKDRICDVGKGLIIT